MPPGRRRPPGPSPRDDALERPRRPTPAGRRSTALIAFHSGDRPSRRALAALAGVVTLFAAAYAVNVSRGFNAEDEAWFLQVVARTNGGEVLYRDVFFGSTPLGVYLSGAVTRVLGTEMLVLKGVSVAVFAVTSLLAFHLARGFGLGRKASAAVVMALGVLALPTIGLYGDLASTLLLATLALALRWVQLGTDQAEPPAWWRHPLVLGGVTAGLCFGAKQNVGALALAALAATALLAPARPAPRRRRLLDAARPAPAFVVVVGAVLAPVVLSGALPEFWDYGFANKGSYLRLGGKSYLDQLTALGRLVRGLPGGLLQTTLQAVVLLPALAVVATAATWPRARAGERRRAVAVAAFLVAGLLAVYPRADSAHLADAAPVCAVAVAYAASRWAPALPRARRTALAATFGGLLLATLATVGWAAVTITSPDHGALAVPHFGGVPLPSDERARLSEQVRALDALGPDHLPVFLLSREAGFGYLSTGLSNPTPFDYPVATAFGRHGQADTMGAVRQGRIASVCRDPAIDDPLRPAALDSFVTGRLRPVGDIGPCWLYVAGR